MMYYMVKPEFVHRWSSYASTVIVTASDIIDMAFAWEVSVESLHEQVEEIDGDNLHWYAVIYDSGYAWDFGSYDFDEAVQMALEENFTETKSGELEIADIDMKYGECCGAWTFTADRLPALSDRKE